MQSNTSARQGMPMQSSPQDGHVSGWFERTRTRLFGKRDPVEAQLRDIARQGTFGAMVSHFFATLLIILFSAASLIALGADSMRAVLASLSHGTLDIPNAVATGVTALLVPAMDVAILRAASKIRLLATRRATKSEMALHIGVVVIISGIETCTYCYMAGVYEHPESGVAWALIIARAMAAPLIGVYLAMDRPHPVTSRDILAQVELGAGAGVIRDVTVIANDADASLDRKMELFGASAVMRDGERDRLHSLIEVARRHSNTTNVVPVPRRAIVAASATLPLTETLEHHVAQANAYKAIHDPDPKPPTDPWADEVYDEDADSDLGDSPWATGVMDENELAESTAGTSTPNSTKQRSRAQSNSGARRTHQQASKQVRETHKKMRLESKQARKRQVREGAFAIFDELALSGESLSLDAIGKRVREMYHLETTPSNNTIMRLRGAWNASRAHKAALDDLGDVEPREPDALRELVTADSW